MKRKEVRKLLKQAVRDKQRIEELERLIEELNGVRKRPDKEIVRERMERIASDAVRNRSYVSMAEEYERQERLANDPESARAEREELEELRNRLRDIFLSFSVGLATNGFYDLLKSGFEYIRIFFASADDLAGEAQVAAERFSAGQQEIPEALRVRVPLDYRLFEELIDQSGAELCRVAMHDSLIANHFNGTFELLHLRQAAKRAVKAMLKEPNASDPMSAATDS